MMALLGCSAEREPSPVASEAVRERFPEQVHQVLEVGTGFLATPEGFASRPRAATPGTFHLGGEPMEAMLSVRAEDGLRFHGRSGFALTVREVGAAGAAMREGTAVTYARAGGRSYWSAMANGGAEEWLLLEAEAVTRDAPVAIWEVEGASVRQQGEGVEVVDGSGRARMSVTAPRAYAEGGSAVGARLVANGGRIELWVEASGEAVLVDPAWEVVKSMSAARASHTATLLPSGQVLSVGGYDLSGKSLASAELYDSTTDTWSPAGPMSTARCVHTATLLLDGMVLVVGGRKDGHCQGPALASAELYDPAKDTWSSISAMNSARATHTATLLPSGQVLVAGGYGEADGVLASAELYDPATRTWSPTHNAMKDARSFHTATLLQNGRVLVAGGFNNNFLASAELYDPPTQTWLPACAMTTPRAAPSSTLLMSGRVLVAGGNINSFDEGYLASAEVYDPPTNQWLQTGTMSTKRSYHSGTLLPSGQVLIVGGINFADVPSSWKALASAELYDPVAGTWLSAGTMSTPRAAYAPVLVPTGQVLIAGGLDQISHPLASAELYTPGGFCVASVCCGAGCSGPCNACSVRLDITGIPEGVTTPGTCEPADSTVSNHCSASACVAGELRSCNRFACVKSTGECRSQCDSVNDCSPGYVCDRTHVCVEPPPVAHELDTSGCVLAPSSTRSSSPWPPAALSLLALAALGARRRGGARRGSPNPRPGATAAT
jgi:hypothetical protein